MTKEDLTPGSPQYDLTIFEVHYGRLTSKRYTKGERVLRIEAIVHNTAVFRCPRNDLTPIDRQYLLVHAHFRELLSLNASPP